MSQHDETSPEGIDEDDLVYLTNDEGEEKAFRFLAVVDVDEQEFALLTPHVEGDESDELTILIFTYTHDEEAGTETFGVVEAGELFDRVVARAESLIRFVDADEE